ncbi:MAG: V-type ATP synthase subunit I [Halobacteriaceae archaeon]
MFRPERMSKVSVTGATTVMDDVVEAVHELNLLHLSEFDGSWEGFEAGDPVEGAEEASEKLVTARSLESTLGVTEADAGAAVDLEDGALADRLETVRTEVNELDDRRSELRDDLRRVEDALDAAEPFVALGIDLDLLRGYDSLEIAVGEADADAVDSALLHADGVRTHEVFAADGAVAAFAAPAEGAEDPLDEALVGVEFARLEVPDAGGDPEEYRQRLEQERRELESRLSNVESELEGLRVEHGGFLLAAEEVLSVRVQRAEAPLSFATTDRAFVAEGWIPTERYDDLVRALRDAVGDRVDVEELERAAYTPNHGHSTEAVADGGTVTTEDSPPVIQDTPGPAKPFELLVQTINRPRYFELDPTVVLFLTFPLFFGFMIGDLAYGVLYAGIGYWLTTNYESAALRSLGGIAIWAGLFTAVFGVLYGEVLGTHLIATHVWEGMLGMHAPMSKGLHALDYATLWLVLSVLAGLLHLAVGWIFGFVNDARAHGAREAFLENGSWLILMVSMWLWIFSTQAAGSKPGFMVGPESVFNGHPLDLGFTGLPPVVIADVSLGPLGTLPLSLWLVGILVGVGLAIKAEGVAMGLLETPTNGLVNVISYTRIAIVLLAKAGMAFVVNLLVFGAYESHHGGETAVHFTYGGHVPHGAEQLFGGLVHMGVPGLVVGAVVLVVGHLVVLALGVTSAGLQAVRLEYVEFFGKFYEGGGENYNPFGYGRRYTTED